MTTIKTKLPVGYDQKLLAVDLEYDQKLLAVDLEYDQKLLAVDLEQVESRLHRFQAYNYNIHPDFKHITAAMIDEHMKDLWQGMQPGMTRKHYKAFAEACTQIEQGIVDLHIPMPEHYRDQVMELVVARIALVCAKDSDRFDSFQFAEAARKNARRGIDGKSGSAARSSARVTKRSKP